MHKRLKKGDLVVVIAGNDRGKSGKIIFMKDEKVVVEGVNVKKKHMKKSQENQKGQIIDLEVPIHISNVKFYQDEKGVKLRVREGKNGREIYYLDENKKPKVLRDIKKVKAK